MYLAIFVYANYLLFKYILWSNGERSTKLFLLFYFLVIAICVCKVGSWIDLEINPKEEDIFEHEFFTCLPISIMLALGWMVTAMLFELTVSIREIFDLANLSHTKWYKRVFYFFSILVCSTQILLIILNDLYLIKKTTIYDLIVAYSLLTGLHSSILILLIYTLSRMERLGTFARACQNIILQFFLFLSSFACNLAIYVDRLSR